MLGTILCASFILSSGVVKSVGAWLLNTTQIGPFWMPAAAGALFLPLLFASVWTLDQLPPPSEADETQRVRRAPMNATERRAFLVLYWPGVVLLTASYVLLTAFRDFRDNFAAEIWAALGYGHASSVFTESELPVAAIALLALAAVMVVRDNLKALIMIHLIIIAGFLLLGASAWAFEAHLISPLTFMILAGAGLCMGYTPFSAMLFDHLVAYSGRVATAGFLIYLADASGYLGSAALLVWRNFGAGQMDWLRFFIVSAYAVSVIGTALAPAAALYFLSLGRGRNKSRL